MAITSQRAVLALKEAAVPMEEGNAAEKMLKMIPEQADWVLIGEGSHGTHEYYQLRADITKLLIERRGFNAVATDGADEANAHADIADWPDAFRVNLWVQHLSDRDGSADEALGDFKRFPTWMWRNREVANFLTWLHDYNGQIPTEEARARRVGFYGLDLYSLFTSTERVLEFLDRVEPEAAKRARQRYSCFDKYGAEAVDYAFGLAMGGCSCEAAAIRQLRDMLEMQVKRLQQVKGQLGEEEAVFSAVANAQVVVDAELYYSQMFFKQELTWNIRDTHMSATADAIAERLKHRGIARPKLVLWAHNSHLGDSRYTDMGRSRNELNLGQLAREKYGEEKVCLVGQVGYKGRVAAADEWGSPCKFKTVTPAMAGSHERRLHEVGIPLFGLDLLAAAKSRELSLALEKPLLERAIGVIYRNESAYVEKNSHFFNSWLGRQFDALVFWEDSDPVAPLDRGKGTLGGEALSGELPETFPFGE